MTNQPSFTALRDEAVAVLAQILDLYADPLTLQKDTIELEDQYRDLVVQMQRMLPATKKVQDRLQRDIVRRAKALQTAA
jgi:hypothetical protein